MSKTRHALVVGALALTTIVGCSNERTTVRRTTVTDRPATVEQHSTTQAPGSAGTDNETVIKTNRSYERTVEE